MRHMWAKSLTQPAVPKRWRLPRCLGDQVRHLLLLTHDVPKRTHRIQRASGSSPSVRFHALVKFTGWLHCRAYYSRPAHSTSYCGLCFTCQDHIHSLYPLEPLQPPNIYIKTSLAATLAFVKPQPLLHHACHRSSRTSPSGGIVNWRDLWNCHCCARYRWNHPRHCSHLGRRMATPLLRQRTQLLLHAPQESFFHDTGCRWEPYDQRIHLERKDRLHPTPEAGLCMEG